MDRIYIDIILHHIEKYQQMVFLAGPRQVGKTTISTIIQERISRSHYLNWDVQEHRQLILSGALTLGTSLTLDFVSQQKSLIIFDEIHKYAKWKNFLKGFYDLYHSKVSIIITGSAKLDLHQRANDSLMGRYFPYRIHPLSIAECINTTAPTGEIRQPDKIPDDVFERLWKFGGFPDPFIHSEETFNKRWETLRREQLFRGDIVELSHIQEIAQLEILAEILKQQTSQLLNRSNLAPKVNVSVNTISRWLNTLENFYFCFLVKPWSKNITRSLIKEPKLYLWDWSDIKDVGARAENFVASHLLKAIHFWTDRGLGEYQLNFVRDKEKNEVDFLVTKNNKPWFLVEVKYSSNQSISESLYRFQNQLNAEHAFQVVFDLPYVDVDCFKYRHPVVVPVTTFLSQLI